MPKKKTTTQETASKKKKKTTSKDMPGTGLAKKAAKALEERKKREKKYGL